MGVLDNPGNQALGNVLGGSTNRLAAGILQMIQNQRGGCSPLSGSSPFRFTHCNVFHGANEMSPEFTNVKQGIHNR